MRFVRRPEGYGQQPELPPTPGERLVRRTGLGLAVFTLALIAILLAAIGLVTAAAAVQITDLSVDSNLHTAAENMLTALAPTPSPTPAPTALPSTAEPTVEPTTTPEETSSGEDTTPAGDGENDGGSRASVSTPAPVSTPLPAPTAPPPPPTPAPAVPPTNLPTPTPTSTPRATLVAGAATDERAPGSSDTFFLILDPHGGVVVNPQRVALTALPNEDAAAVAANGVEDWRTVEADGVRVRLLSEPMFALDGSISGVLQSGFVLTAHDEQQALIVRTIVVASLIGLLGAALVTLFVTRRAMSPIRSAFDAERRFVASASHELKTPLSVVRASAEILQREHLVSQEGQHLVADIVTESDRLGRLVGDLLALASAEAGQISISPTVFDAGSLVDDVVERVSSVAAGRGVKLEATHLPAHDSASGGMAIRADRERMIQLLTILVDNAIDHSPVNGVVRVVARPEEASRADRRVVIDVTDQGPGVPLAQRERIFEPFAKIYGRRRTTGTTGLGLAIARILAARQNATLAVADAPGGGACFSVSLVRMP